MVLLHCYLGLADCWENGAGLAAADVLAERCWLEERCHFFFFFATLLIHQYQIYIINDSIHYIINFLSLFPFGRQVIMLSFRVVDNLPFLKQLFSAFLTKYFKRFQKIFRKSAGRPSRPGVLLFFICFSDVPSSSTVNSSLCLILGTVENVCF